MPEAVLPPWERISPVHLLRGNPAQVLPESHKSPACVSSAVHFQDFLLRVLTLPQETERRAKAPPCPLQEEITPLLLCKTKPLSCSMCSEIPAQTLGVLRLWNRPRPSPVGTRLRHF